MTHTKKPISYCLNKKIVENFWWKKRQENGPLAENDKTKETTGLGRRTRADRKWEPKDSPEIPDRRETSDIPGLPSADVYTGLCAFSVWTEKKLVLSTFVSLYFLI